MRITVVGLGYVGMAMAALLARENDVIALDTDPERVQQVNDRVSPVIDPDISELLASENVHLEATTEPYEAYKNADYVVVATPTDYDTDANSFDTSSVEMVVRDVAQISPTSVVVIKSTIPVGFTHDLQQQHPGLTILFSPEFLREGKALRDNLRPSRIVVAGEREAATKFGDLLAKNALEPNVPVLITGTTEAEAIKLFANTYLAMRVAFFNELDSFAVNHNLSSPDIVAGVSLDPRIGNFYNNPSFGYGGYCLPKDTKQLLATYEGIPQNLIHAVVEANKTRKDFIAAQVLSGNPEVVGVYKLAMKAGSDNFRSSAIQDVIERVEDQGVPVILYEPMIEELQFEGIEVVNNLSEFKRRASIILTNRYAVELEDVGEKVFTRDIFGRD